MIVSTPLFFPGQGYGDHHLNLFRMGGDEPPYPLKITVGVKEKDDSLFTIRFRKPLGRVVSSRGRVTAARGACGSLHCGSTVRRGRGRTQAMGPRGRSVRASKRARESRILELTRRRWDPYREPRRIGSLDTLRSGSSPDYADSHPYS
jgi:hypothetical protein